MVAPQSASGTDEDFLRRAARQRDLAQQVAGDLDLVARWSTVGKVVLVGAVAYDLVVSPDLDYEVFTGFRVLAALAELPSVTAARFSNALDMSDTLTRSGRSTSGHLLATIRDPVQPG